MVFSSMTFLYMFLPVVILLYFLSKNIVYKNTVLLIFSLIFYSWGEPKFIVLMLLSSLVAYVFGIGIDKCERMGKKGQKKALFIISVVLICAALFVFKYLNFAIDTVSFVSGYAFDIKEIVLPIGISFYTFQILSYVIDLYWGKVKVQKNYFYLTLYVSFFPQLIAGPIVRYETVEREIHTRKETFADAAEGLRRFSIGLAKKVIIANSVAVVPLVVYGADSAVMGSGMYWLAAIGYALQIYFDFSGYSDMAIGLGRIFGFHFLENFNYPYVSVSITDFWRRWHMSLSGWFRDYIYIPLGGNRVKKPRFIFNVLVVWCLTGFWHGAEWNFVLWGVYYGVFLLLEKLVWKKLLDKMPKAIAWCYSMFIVLIGWVIFNLTDFAKMGDALKMMFSFVPTDITKAFMTDTQIIWGLLFVPVGIVCMLPWKNWIKLPDNNIFRAATYVISFVLLVVSIVFTISSSYNPFIYFRF